MRPSDERLARTVTLRFGRGTVSFDVPELQFAGEVRPRPVTPAPELDSAVRQVLAEPLASQPLSQLAQSAETALILTVDYTRPSPRPLLEPVLEVLAQASVTPTVAIATGRHRQMSEEEIVQHLGEELCTRCRVVQHDAYAPDIHESRGQTSRGTPIRFNRLLLEPDLVLGVGFLEPTYLAGFSGARKLIMPGLAWHESIDVNHYLVTDPRTRVGVLEGNPLSEDAEEFARDLPLDFILYSVLGPHDETAAIVAGDRYQAHRQGCRRSAEIYRVAAPQADIVISSAGGYPYDCDLVQGKKAIIPAYELVKPGGAIILVSATEEGWGAEETFERWVKELTPQEIVEKVRDPELFCLGAHGANILAKPVVDKQVRLIALTGEDFADELAGTFVYPTSDPVEAMAWALERTGPHATVVAIHQARRLIIEPQEA